MCKRQALVLLRFLCALSHRVSDGHPLTEG